MAERWDDIRRDFQRFVARTGARRVARMASCHYVTVYRLIRGDTCRPRRATQERLERVLSRERSDP